MAPVTKAVGLSTELKLLRLIVICKGSGAQNSLNIRLSFILISKFLRQSYRACWNCEPK